LARHCQKETFGHSKARFITFVSKRKEELLKKASNRLMIVHIILIFYNRKEAYHCSIFIGSKDDGVNDFPPSLFYSGTK
jgi:hypothetical protein